MADDTEETQETLVKEFRKALEDILPPHISDYTLLKWLKLRNYDLKKAAHHYRRVDSAFKAYELDNLIENYEIPEVMKKYQYNGCLGFAKDGTIVRYMGMCDFPGFIMSLRRMEMSEFFVYTMTRDLKIMREEKLRRGMDASKEEILYIIDCDTIAVRWLLSKIVIEVAYDLFHLFQECFPEIWSYFIFINTSTIFDMCFNVFKPMFRDTFLKKLVILSRDNTADFLRKLIDPEVLPKHLGGNRVDSNNDPKCREFISYGGKIPRSYYINDLDLIKSSDPGVKSAVVGSRSVHNVLMTVKDEEKRIKVEYRTDSGSMNFATFCMPLDSDKEIVPSTNDEINAEDLNSTIKPHGMRMKYHCNYVTASFILRCFEPGIYIMQFDNKDSWFGSRKLLYRFTMLDKNC